MNYKGRYDNGDEFYTESDRPLQSGEWSIYCWCHISIVDVTYLFLGLVDCDDLSVGDVIESIWYSKFKIEYIKENDGIDYYVISNVPRS